MKYLFLLFTLFLTACSTTYPNNNVIDQAFPAVKGNTLTKEAINLPSAFEGKQTLLLLGYVQDSQFDIDRWLIALDMTETKVDVYEIPAIQGMFPRMFQTYIDNGMRKGIPKELWKGVITVYEDGEQLQAFTGNTLPNNARVILLGTSGKVQYFYDRGFSVSALNDVRDLINN